MTDPKTIWALSLSAAREITVSNTAIDPSVPLDPYSRSVAELLFGTAAKESNLVYERQLSPEWSGNVGGFGLWQVELETAVYLLEYISVRATLADKVYAFLFGPDRSAPRDWALRLSEDRLAGMLLRDPRLGVALARIKYLTIPAAIPYPEDGVERREAHALYWLRYYNGYGCVKHHTRETCVNQYTGAFERLCLPVISRKGYELE
jgi:hypothetical protein